MFFIYRPDVGSADRKSGTCVHTVPHTIHKVKARWEHGVALAQTICYHVERSVIIAHPIVIIAHKEC